MQLKQSYDRVKHIRKQSGWGWNNKKNLPKVSDETWDTYVKVSDISLSYMITLRIYLQAHPKSKQWCTKPFCYVLETPIFIFLLLTNTFPSHDLFPPPFHHMTLSPDCSKYSARADRLDITWTLTPYIPEH